MQLAYQSQRQNELQKQFEHWDKMYKSLVIPSQNCNSLILPEHTKQKITRLLKNDQGYQLRKFLEKQAISLDAQIGPLNSSWTIFHECVQNNSLECLEYILKTLFQQNQSKYEEIINKRAFVGSYPIIIAINHKCYECLQKILKYGGVNIYVIDNQKCTPYELAIKYRDQKIIKMLMNYETKCKNKKFINTNLLNQPVILQDRHSIYSKLVVCLTSCLSLGMYVNNNQQHKSLVSKKNQSIIRQNQNSKISHISIEQISIDDIPYEKTDSIMGRYTTQWKRASQGLRSGQIPIFGAFNPFSIRQNNMSIKNNLIVFQCFSQYTWLIRRIVAVDRMKPYHYDIILYRDLVRQKINIDEYIPWIQEKKQPLFISNEKQLWPILLQKGLAKLNNGYECLNRIKIQKLISQLTGCYTTSIKINNQLNIIQLIKVLTSKNFLYVLYGYYQQNAKRQLLDLSFHILDCHGKEGSQFILINSSTYVKTLKQNQPHETIEMKVIKSRYGSYNQMCVWIAKENIYRYFDRMVVSCIVNNFQRTQVKALCSKNTIFFKIKLNKTVNEEILLSFFNEQTQQAFSTQNIDCFKNQNQSYWAKIKTDSEIKEVLRVPYEQGNYLFKYQFPTLNSDTNKKIKLLLISWASMQLAFEHIDLEIGVLQWFASCKQSIKNNWNESNQYFIETVENFHLIIYKSCSQNNVWMHNAQIEDIIEGKNIDEKFLLIKDQQYFYGIIKGSLKTQQLIFETN